MRAAEIVMFLFLLALIAWSIVRLIGAGERQSRLREAHWRPAVHSLRTGGYQVVVECEGEPSQVVRELPAGMDADEFSTRLAEARAEADEHAAALNAARRALPR